MYPLENPDRVYQWDGDLYLGYAETNYSEWHEYEDGLPVHTKVTFLNERYAEAWASYDDQGRLIEHRLGKDSQDTRTTYTLNEMGGLTDRLIWRLDTDEASHSRFIHDSSLNLTEQLDEDGRTSTYTFDCHPPQ